MVIDTLTGNFINLRCATDADAEFTLAIRNDPDRTKILPPIHNTLQQQKEWINKQTMAQDSCFMIIESLAGEALGTLSFYNIDWEKGVCEVGRACSYGSPMANIEANILLLDYLFEKQGFKKTYTRVQVLNKQVKTLNENFGYNCFKEENVEWGGLCCFYELYPEKYYLKRKKIVKLLNAVNN